MADDRNPHIEPTPAAPMPPMAGGEAEDTPLGQEISAVAESGGKKTTFMVLGGLILLYVMYGMLFGGEDKEEQPVETKLTTGQVEKETTLPTLNEGLVSAPPPAPEEVPLPPLPPEPTLPQDIISPITPTSPTGQAPLSMGGAPLAFNQQPGMRGTPPTPGQAVGGANFSEKEQAKIKANMMLKTGSGKFAEGQQEFSQGIMDNVAGGADSGAAGSGTDGAADERSSVNEIGNPQLFIGQGKIIPAVLETAINTDLPGALRAVVSRDVYAEQGKNVLIPRGSRLIGSYNTDIKRGQARVYIVWNRLMLPGGYDLALGSPIVDALGRSGIPGHVDNKYFELFSNSLLLSSLSVGFAAVVDAVTDSQGIEQGQTGSGDATTSGSVIDIATLEAVNDFSNQVQGVVEELVQITPTLTVNQGTAVKIFVNKDIFFPEDLALRLTEGGIIEASKMDDKASNAMDAIQ